MARTVLQPKCPFCGKPQHEVRREVFGHELFIKLECSHTVIKPAIEAEEIWPKSSDGREVFPFQKEGVKFLEAADCNGLLLDEQGLGKTVQECMLLRRNPDLLPALIVVKSGLRAQWFAEIVRWTGMLPQVILGSRDKPDFDLFDIIIVSIDTLRLLRPDVKHITPYDEAKGKKKALPVWTDELCARFKHICIDESQLVKNPGSARTQALRVIAAAANGGQKARVVCMSGTIIEKSAAEYFVPLNLVRPEMFGSERMWDLYYVAHNKVTGKPMGLQNPEVFRQQTSDFIIRRKRIDVLPDLPKIFRQFKLAEMEGDELKTYIKVVEEFQEFMEKATRPTPTDILGYLQRMRHITGVAKVNAALDFIESFLLESERKLVVFLHHKMAGDILLAKLTKSMKEGGWAPPLYYHSGLEMMHARPALIEEFRKPENRIMLASTQAGGVGLNLQFCQDFLQLERQFNPSIEEQAEARFPRPRPEDPWPVGAKINGHYLIMAGTVDDFLTTLVEEKRRNVNQTLDGEAVIEWNQDSLLVELGRALQAKGLKKWRL